MTPARSADFWKPRDVPTMYFIGVTTAQSSIMRLFPRWSAILGLEASLGGLVWELNYRGELNFLRQARGQAASRGLRVEDGWAYFLHGWARGIAEVFHLDLTPALFAELGRAAEELRPQSR